MAHSQQRSRTPILGVSDSPETARRLCLYWGVTPLQSHMVTAPVQELLESVVKWCRAQDILHSGKRIVLVTSTDWSAAGHDLMIVHQVA
jgi:pyruvate kinase